MDVHQSRGFSIRLIFLLLCFQNLVYNDYMREFFFKRLMPLALVLMIFGVTSCERRAMTPPRYDLSSSIEYLEAPADYFIGDMIRLENDFMPLDKSDLKNIPHLVENKGNCIWLRIRFDIPKNMRGNDMGLYIGYMNTANRLFINNAFVRAYGSFPPVGLGAGFQSQYFMFPRNILREREPNTILIQMWAETPFSVSDQIFLSVQSDVYRTAERSSFFKSKIYLCFAVLMVLVVALYLLLFVLLRRFDEYRAYLYFGLLVLYSMGFLLPFFIAEISWIKPIFVSFFAIIKWFMCFGIFTACFFSSSFLTNWLHYNESKKITVIRLILWAVPLVIMLSMPDFDSLITCVKILSPFVLAQFFFCTPNILRALKDSTRHELAVQGLVGYIPVGTGITLDIVFRLIFKNSNLPFFTIYGWQLTLYVFLFYLMSRFAHMYVHSIALKEQLTEFNAHLESEVAIRTKELSETNFMLSRGLESVGHVQRNFLPRQHKSFCGWDLSVSYKPLDSDVSGDLYDYYYTDQTLDGLGIFDVSGHGIPAGLMTILAKGIISQHFLMGISHTKSISAILKDINVTYIKEKSNVENYITGVLVRTGDFDADDVCDVALANAGHPAPLLFSTATNEVREVKHPDPDEQYGILGVDNLPVSFPPVNFRMALGDVFVAFTDGLTEAPNAAEEEFGKERIAKTLQKNAGKSAEEIKDAIMAAYSDFIGAEKQFDDITLIVLKRTSSKDYIEEI